ncbi:MAG: hypothetical protein HY711_02150, partial [Candidatus Melainabacteria bacterium]|nr:hypothetical protein [Candidatus Melainabacteria bacterium]
MSYSFHEGICNLRDTGLKKAQEILAKTQELSHNAYDSFAYSAIQSPVNGLVQLVGGDKYLPQVQFMEAPKPTEFACPNWYAQQLGGGLGMTIPFLLTRGITRGVARLAHPALSAEKFALLANTTNRSGYLVAEAALSGALYDGLLRPISTEEGNFWTARLKNAVVGGITFATLAKTTHGLQTRT